MSLAYSHLFHAGDDPAAPPLLLLHGTGGDEHDLLPLGRALFPGSALLSPRGDVLEGGAPRFFRRYAEGVFDLEDVARRTQAMAEFVAEAAKRYGFPAEKLLALGYSNGANLASSLLLLRPESLAGAALLRPMVIFDPAPPPSGSLRGKAVLLLNGERDPIVPGEHPARLATTLRERGAHVTARLLKAGHGLIEEDFTAVRHWRASRGE